MARDPKAEVEITAQSRTLGAKLREARAKFGKFGAELKKDLFGESFISKAGAHAVGNIASNAFGKVGGYLEDQAKGVYDFQKQLTRLQIVANKSPEFMQAFADSVRKTSNETGLGANQVLSAAKAYVALTGDMDGAAASSRTWARVAQATDSNIADVAQTAAALKQQMNINPDQMEAAFSALAIQGKEGAIELKDLAAQLSNIAPQWAMFKDGTGLDGLKQMGAALQVVKQGFGGDASETVTGLQSMLTALVKNSGRFQKAGIKIFDVDPKTHVKTMRNVLDIVNSIADSRLTKDPAKLEKAFGRVEAYRAYLQLSKNKDLLQSLIEKAGDTSVIARDLNTYVTSPAGRVERSLEAVKNKIAEAITPERIEAFANAMEAAAERAEKLVGFLGKVGGFLGSLEGVGESVRGSLDHVDGSEYSTRDMHLSNTGGGFDIGGDNSDQARAARLAGAKSRMADVDAFNEAKNAIMGAEADGKSTPASIRAAFAAKYNSRAFGQGHVGGEDAGRRYLEAAKVADPVEVALKEMQKITAAGQAAKASEVEKATLDVLRDIAKKLDRNGDIVMDGSKVNGATKNAAIHARRP